MTHHFSCSGREKVVKIFSGHFDQIGPNLGPKKREKRWILVKILRKKLFFSKFLFFWIERFWVEKRSKKWWKKIFLCKIVWHLAIFGQKNEFFRDSQNSSHRNFCIPFQVKRNESGSWTTYMWCGGRWACWSIIRTRLYEWRVGTIQRLLLHSASRNHILLDDDQ